MARLRLFLAILAIAAIPWTAVAQTGETISISLTDHAFSPASLVMKAGTVYRLHFINAGSKNHNFTASEFFAASQLAPDDQAKVKRGTIAVDKGQEVEVAVTPVAGSYPFTCTRFMHKMMGMHGSITVQ
ncbi:MAG TPA: cupredoxin domain-containing protein [Rhizomicrobium sp.]|nr:cupredoxin domain-containing protein [Rhizomicrobium sp.]